MDARDSSAEARNVRFYLRVIVEVPQVEVAHPVDAGEQCGIGGGPHDVVHVVGAVLEGVQWFVALTGGGVIKKELHMGCIICATAHGSPTNKQTCQRYTGWFTQ